MRQTRQVNRVKRVKQWNLIRLRGERGMYQRDVAEHLGITNETYGMKERGQLQFSMNEMFMISRLFETSMDEIFLPRNFGNTEVVEEDCK